MIIKKRNQTFEMIESPDCSSDLKADYMYDPKTKRYYHPPGRRYTIGELFEDRIAYGTDDESFQILMHADKRFSKMWKDLRKTLTPRFKKGDLVVFPSESSAADSKFSLNSPIWIVGEILSWKKVCDWRDKSQVTFECTRDFTRCDSAEKQQAYESKPIPVEKMDELKAANKVLMMFKKSLANVGIKNATLNYLGKAYKI